MQHVRLDRVLLTRSELDLVPDGECIGAELRRSARRALRRRALDVEVDDPAAAAEGLLLARRPVGRGMSVLGARLAREEHELLGADTVGVHVDDQLEPDLVEPREAEVRDLEVTTLLLGQDDAALGERRGRTRPRCTELVLREHPDSPFERMERPAGRYFGPRVREYDCAP